MNPARADRHINVCAVVVTFNPERRRFQALLNATWPQVQSMVIVDNGSEPETLAWLQSTAELAPVPTQCVALAENRGVAAAQNVGIRHFRRARNSDRLTDDAAGTGATAAVLLLDHDSVPERDMVVELSAALLHFRSTGHRIAAVGPDLIDSKRAALPPFSRVSGFRLQRINCKCRAQTHESDYLIASGSLVPLDTFDAVGLLDESLFIDYVDIEWGLRARTLGYRCFGICSARLSHELGDTIVQLGSRSITLHSPLRHYYLFRNALLLYRRKGLPVSWKAADGFRMLVRLIAYSAISKPRLKHIGMMLRGIRDGVMGRSGPFR